MGTLPANLSFSPSKTHTSNAPKCLREARTFFPSSAQRSQEGGQKRLNLISEIRTQRHQGLFFLRVHVGHNPTTHLPGQNLFGKLFYFRKRLAGSNGVQLGHRQFAGEPAPSFDRSSTPRKCKCLVNWYL